MEMERLWPTLQFVVEIERLCPATGVAMENRRLWPTESFTVEAGDELHGGGYGGVEETSSHEQISFFDLGFFFFLFFEICFMLW